MSTMDGALDLGVDMWCYDVARAVSVVALWDQCGNDDLCCIAWMQTWLVVQLFPQMYVCLLPAWPSSLQPGSGSFLQLQFFLSMLHHLLPSPAIYIYISSQLSVLMFNACFHVTPADILFSVTGGSQQVGASKTPCHIKCHCYGKYTQCHH